MPEHRCLALLPCSALVVLPPVSSTRKTSPTSTMPSLAGPAGNSSHQGRQLRQPPVRAASCRTSPELSWCRLEELQFMVAEIFSGRRPAAMGVDLPFLPTLLAMLRRAPAPSSVQLRRKHIRVSTIAHVSFPAEALSDQYHLSILLASAATLHTGISEFRKCSECEDPFDYVPFIYFTDLFFFYAGSQAR